MDRIDPDHEAREPDGAEQAFEALRQEVAALRRGVELVYRQGQEAKGLLGAIAKELKAVTARLGAMEQAPALATTPASQAIKLRDALDRIGQDARKGLERSQADLAGTVRGLNDLVASLRARKHQRRCLWAVGVLGIVGGLLLRTPLTAVMPWGGKTWLAAQAFGGRWHADQAMMRDADPVVWNRMVRLYKACRQKARPSCARQRSPLEPSRHSRTSKHNG